jgi:regulator of RNase E activity RraA
MRVADDIVAQYAQLATPTIANALDDVSFAGVMVGLSQIVPGTRCVGRAVTVRQVTGERGDFRSEDFKVGDMIEAAAPGEVLVIDNADREEMDALGLPVFARHMTPLTGRTRIALSAINQTVSCGGVRVRPGDVVVADGSGVLCIPAEHAAQVAALAAKYASDDAAAAAELARGLTFRQAMAKFTRI